MAEDKGCEILCHDDQAVTMTIEDSKLVAERIRHAYYVHL